MSRRNAFYALIGRNGDILYQIELLSRNWCSFLCIDYASFYNFPFSTLKKESSFPSNSITPFVQSINAKSWLMSRPASTVDRNKLLMLQSTLKTSPVFLFNTFVILFPFSISCCLHSFFLFAAMRIYPYILSVFSAFTKHTIFALYSMTICHAFEQTIWLHWTCMKYTQAPLFG